VYLFKKIELEPGQYWEKTAQGTKRLVQLNPTTGKEMYIFHSSMSEDDYITLFKLEIDLSSGRVSFKESIDVSKLDPNVFELFYDGDV